CAPGTEIERARKLGPRWTVSPIPRASKGDCASLCFGVPGLAGLDGSWRTFPEGGLGRETGVKGLKIPLAVVRFRRWAHELVRIGREFRQPRSLQYRFGVPNRTGLSIDSRFLGSVTCVRPRGQ